MRKYENEGIDGLFSGSNAENYKVKAIENNKAAFDMSQFANVDTRSYENQVAIEVKDSEDNGELVKVQRKYF